MSDSETGPKAVLPSVKSPWEKPRRTFDEWFAYWSGRTDLHAERRAMSQEERDDLAEDLWDMRRKNREGHNAGPPLTPADFGYDPSDFEHEYWAESFRAYLRNPNAFKQVAPNVAAVIREWVNEHPVLARFIQFNSLAGAALSLPAAPDHAQAGWDERPSPR